MSDAPKRTPRGLPAQDPVDALAAALGREWVHIAAARTAARQARSQLRQLCRDLRVGSDDTSVVLFGSLARDEFTAGSDVDWTYLIDGQASADHLVATRRLDAAVREQFKSPGPTGTFGGMTFSHQLVHHIGGEDDSNANTTHRILLLLESKPVQDDDDPAYGRVIRGILGRYLSEQASPVGSDGRYRVPRFLQNDIVRYWRIMAVDFAHKQWLRGGVGWGLRNTKLRFSRKLIYAAGLLTCYSCSIDPALQRSASEPGDPILPLLSHLRGYVRMTPLQILARTLLQQRCPDDLARRLFDSYDGFLGLLNDAATRTALEELRAEDADRSDVFSTVQTLGGDFQEALNGLFFDHAPFAALTRSYGVF